MPPDATALAFETGNAHVPEVLLPLHAVVAALQMV
jgi:hypothetical protein